jgi:hypothetical protein
MLERRLSYLERRSLMLDGGFPIRKRRPPQLGWRLLSRHRRLS